MNKFKTMRDDMIKAQNEFDDYSKKCIEVDLTLSRSELPEVDVMVLHILIEKYSPRVINYSCVSNGGVDNMKLVAPVNEVIEALEIAMMGFKDRGNDYMVMIIEKFTDYIQSPNIKKFSMSKMLRTSIHT